jgi:hypothetical protein
MRVYPGHLILLRNQAKGAVLEEKNFDVMRNRMRYLAIIFVLLGCTSEVNRENQVLKDAVRRYNRAAMEAYRVGTVEPLQGKVTQKERGRLELLIGLLKNKRVFLDGSLKSIDFREVMVRGEDRASISTEEQWEYRHIDTLSRAVVSPKEKAHYSLIYHLVKKKGLWLVDRVEKR